jgi:hypothetical protein
VEALVQSLHEQEAILFEVLDAFRLDGRPSQRLLRPDIDLTAALDELEREGWIVPLRGTRD